MGGTNDVSYRVVEYIIARQVSNVQSRQLSINEMNGFHGRKYCIYAIYGKAMACFRVDPYVSIVN